ncbi:MAG TPA: (2Fe-2S) ferredoxin domain-containing protein [Sedimentisphaerales bacterium]|nr:(2Fe-2S) ferredoxin domain-containing protein [Sedimentisphaerales bacterium]
MMTCKITICMGSSCFSRGNSINLEILEEFIAHNRLEQSVELIGSRCLGQCSAGPLIHVDNEIYSQVDRGALLDILHKKFAGTGCRFPASPPVRTTADLPPTNTV